MTRYMHNKIKNNKSLDKSRKAPFKGLITVSSDEFWANMEVLLGAARVREIKAINSAEKFQNYCNKHGMSML